MFGSFFHHQSEHFFVCLLDTEPQVLGRRKIVGYIYGYTLTNYKHSFPTSRLLLMYVPNSVLWYFTEIMLGGGIDPTKLQISGVVILHFLPIPKICHTSSEFSLQTLVIIPYSIPGCMTGNNFSERSKHTSGVTRPNVYLRGTKICQTKNGILISQISLVCSQ